MTHETEFLLSIIITLLAFIGNGVVFAQLRDLKKAAEKQSGAFAAYRVESTKHGAQLEERIKVHGEQIDRLYGYIKDFGRLEVIAAKLGRLEQDYGLLHDFKRTILPQLLREFEQKTETRLRYIENIARGKK